MPTIRPLLICVVGPTAIGKTNLAIRIAKAFETEIISADSRQFFKEMNIGTAVPSEKELSAIPHHFIQNRSIFDNYSVGDFEKDGLQKLKELFKHHNQVIMVGGSGLYVDAITKGLDYFPEVPDSIRQELNKQLQNHGIEFLQKELKEKDPEYYNTADIQNPHRLIRALEICIGTGETFTSFRKQNNKERDFDCIYIGLTAPREVVYDRINRRVDIMIKEGLVEEAKQLFKYRHLNALQTVGYKELFEYFDGTISLEEAISEIKKNTRRFAKRQGTWFKRNEEINWFHFETSSEEIINVIHQKSAQ